MLKPARIGPKQCLRVLDALWHAEQHRLLLTDRQLIDALDGEPSGWATRRCLGRLERVGLISRSGSRVVLTDTHVWSERRVSLTDLGRVLASYTAGEVSLAQHELRN